MKFNERKAAQIAAFFLGQCQGRRMSHLKLMKLMYLSDREAVRSFGWPISGDRMVSMPHGPVLSQTLNLMDGDVESGQDGWESWVSAKENHELSLRNDFDLNALDELSPAELSVMHKVWCEFGSMSKWAIRDWTHENCPEWEDPKGSSFPIKYESLARAVGFGDSEARELALQMEEEREIDNLFASL